MRPPEAEGGQVLQRFSKVEANGFSLLNCVLLGIIDVAMMRRGQSWRGKRNWALDLDENQVIHLASYKSATP